MLNEVINHLVKDMTHDIENIITKYEGKDRKIKGDIGELFIGRAMKYTLLDMGYRCHPNHFWIQPQYGADENNQGGIDFKVTIRTTSNTYVFLVEAKNWADYPTSITPSTFRTEILDRFTSIDPLHNYRWIVTMNQGNISDISEFCSTHGIHVIPLDMQLTPDLDYNKILEQEIRGFVTEFGRYIQSVILLDNNSGSPTEEQLDMPTIRNYLRKGIPDKIILSKFHMKQQNLDVIKSKMRKNGEDIVYKRSEHGKQIKDL
jgi:hypothetical protein